MRYFEKLARPVENISGTDPAGNPGFHWAQEEPKTTRRKPKTRAPRITANQKSWVRGGLIGAGAIGGGAVGSLLNTEDSALGTLAGGVAGGAGAAFATGGPDTMKKITPKIMDVIKKIRGK